MIIINLLREDVRRICIKCSYPIVTCICAYIIEQRLPFAVTILQHPKEVQNAKNTARLAKLVSPKISIVKTDDKDLLNSFKQKLSFDHTLILYPNNHSVPLISDIRSNIDIKSQYTHLIVLDGTWRQAYQIWQTNEWLWMFNSYHFEAPNISRYVIRKSKETSHLSTIESIAQFAHLVHDVEPHRYFNAQKALVKVWNKYSSKRAKSRNNSIKASFSRLI